MAFNKTGSRAPLIDRADFELACIREFSHSGLHLGVGVSSVERRERIRAAILREKKARWIWRDSGVTYAEVFRQVYHEALGEEASKIVFDQDLRHWGIVTELDDDDPEDLPSAEQ